MKRLFLSLVIVTSFTFSSNISTAIDNFGFKLFSKISNSSKNIIISSASIYTALLLVELGAKRDTKKELQNILDSREFSQDDIKRLQQRLQSSKDYNLTSINSIWIQKNLKIKDDFKTKAKEIFEASVEEVDFYHHPIESIKKINKWVEIRSNHLIKNFLSENKSAKEIVAILLNVIYFNGIWESSFKHTKKGIFFGLNREFTIDMMRQTSKFRVYKTDALKAIELPYRGDFSMVVVVPENFLEFEKGLSFDKLKSIVSNFGRKRRIQLIMPKFRAKYHQDLIDSLKKMGMRLSTSSRADFSGIFESAKFGISKVIHESVIEVSEKGTKASAATAVVFTKSVRRVEDFIVNKPFFFFIIDKRDGLILFMGRVLEPKAFDSSF